MCTCCRIIAVGVTTANDPADLQSIASSADFTIPISTFQSFENAFGVIEQMICDELPTVPTPDTSDLCCPYDFPQYARLY